MHGWHSARGAGHTASESKVQRYFSASERENFDIYTQNFGLELRQQMWRERRRAKNELTVEHN